MIDLTPLDVRNKRGDFRKGLRGYDPQEVDVFLELVAERLEQLVRENLQLKERSQTLQQQVSSQTGREQAVQEALVTAQELRSDIRSQAQREAEHIVLEARTEGRRLLAEAEAQVRQLLRDAERRLEQGQEALDEMERRRIRFLKSFKQLLQREMDVVEVEEERPPLEERPIDLNLGGGLFGGREETVEPEEVAPAEETHVDLHDHAAEHDDPGVEEVSDPTMDAVAEPATEAAAPAAMSLEDLAPESPVMPGELAEAAPDLASEPAGFDPPADGFFGVAAEAAAHPATTGGGGDTRPPEADPPMPAIPTLDDLLSESESGAERDEPDEDRLL